KKKALIALAHSILTVAYHVLKTTKPFCDLGADYFERLHRDRIRRYHAKRLEHLGYKVKLTEEAA
ncbi:MAG: IS110 family transposase, partial [Acidobacteriia bacterium]|nr:IS110 family transposase [Terriglobia bacterium]